MHLHTLPLNHLIHNAPAPDAEPCDDLQVICAASWDGKPLPPRQRWYVEGWEPVDGTLILADGMEDIRLPALQSSAGARAFRFLLADWLREGEGNYLAAVSKYRTGPKQVLRIARRLSAGQAKVETWVPPYGEIFCSNTLSGLLWNAHAHRGGLLIVRLAEGLCTNPQIAQFWGWIRHFG